VERQRERADLAWGLDMFRLFVFEVSDGSGEIEISVDSPHMVDEAPSSGDAIQLNFLSERERHRREEGGGGAYIIGLVINREGIGGPISSA
jgi:hypothetical protein